jgi:hypothetical protein
VHRCVGGRCDGLHRRGSNCLPQRCGSFRRRPFGTRRSWKKASDAVVAIVACVAVVACVANSAFLAFLALLASGAVHLAAGECYTRACRPGGPDRTLAA